MTYLALIALLLALGARLFLFDRPVAKAAAPAARRPTTKPAGPPPPDLDDLQWSQPPAPLGEAALAARLRDRYIAARFGGTMRSSADLLQVEMVIKAARLCFEEERYDCAQELLDMAIEQSPGDVSLRLAQLEIAFLRRDADLFTRLATEFRAVFPRAGEFAEIARLGRSIAPGEALFAAGAPAGANAHYGPWPDMPNWIQASWDLTAEVLAADFHRAMRDQAASSHVAARNAA